MEIPAQAIQYMKQAIDSYDIILVRELCREFGIPETIRLDVWKMFLQPKKEIVEPQHDPSKNKRFRPLFIPESEKTLIDECNRIAQTIQSDNSNIVYNYIVEIAAIISKAFPTEPVEIRCGLTKAIIYKFQPFYKHMPKDCITQFENLIHILLLYHDPLLSIHLDTNRIEPYEYTKRFCFTLCMNMCADITTILKVWDEFITFPDITLYVYCVVGYMIYLRKQLLEGKEHAIVLNVLNKKLKLNDLKTIVAYSKAIRLSTSSSFNRILVGLFSNSDSYQKVFAKSLTSSLFLTSLSTDIIGDKLNRQVPFLFIDCRREELFDLGTIPAAINLDHLKRQEDKKYMEDLFKKELSLLTQQNSDFHVVLFGHDDKVDSNPDIGELSMIGLDFAKRGVKRVSIMQQGYISYHKNALANVKGFQVANHEPETCPICSGKSINGTNAEGPKSFAQSAFAKTQQFAGGLMDFFSGSKKKDVPKKENEPQTPKQQVPQQNITNTMNTATKEDDDATNPFSDNSNAMKQYPPQPNLSTNPFEESSNDKNPFNDTNQSNQSSNPFEDQPNETNEPTNPFEEEDPKEKGSKEDDEESFLREVIEESSQYNSYLNIGGKQTIWKPVITVLTKVAIFVIEKQEEKIILLENINYETITKIVMKKAEPERFTIVHTGGRCTIRIPEVYKKFVEEISLLQE